MNVRGNAPVPENKRVRLCADTVRAMLPARPRAAHKGMFGRLLIVAGSRAYRGAALLAAEGALRSGAGLVRLASTEAVCAAAAARLPACTLQPLGEGEWGGVSARAAGGLDLAWPSAVLAGSGMGNTADTAQLVRSLLRGAACPLVLDADALNVLDRDFTFAAPALAITPHVGEMARLCGISAAEVARGLEATAAAYARKHRCTVVLKSHVSVVAAPGGEVYINDGAGNAGLAKGGSGDVLAGMAGALAAQGLALPQAAAAAVWLHASAADAAAAELGEAAMSPMDLPAYLGRVLKSVGW